MSEEERLLPKEDEKFRTAPKIIGVIGPHGIGKDEILSSLDIPGVRVFSIGQHIRERLIEVDDQEEAVRLFATVLDKARVRSEDVRLNELNGLQLVDEIKYNYENRVPIPEEVADWILKSYLNECPDDTKVILQSGGPYGEQDFKLNPPDAIILVAPTSKEWIKVIAEREKKETNQSDFKPLKEWEKWKARVKKVLKLANTTGIPVLHINMSNPQLSKEEVNDKLNNPLTEFIDRVKKGEPLNKLSGYTVE